MTCAYCGNAIDGRNVCQSCGAFQLKRRDQEIKLPAPIYRLLMAAVDE